nr:hypothetical protein CFP56_44482 [Quercus suber]
MSKETRIVDSSISTSPISPRPLVGEKQSNKVPIYPMKMDVPTSTLHCFHSVRASPEGSMASHLHWLFLWRTRPTSWGGGGFPKLATRLIPTRDRENKRGISGGRTCWPCRRLLSGVAQPGEKFDERGMSGWDYFGGSLTLLLSHARPSKIPSPVVAQLGSTFQTWFLATRSSSSMSETSLGRIAVVERKERNRGQLGFFLHAQVKLGLTSCNILLVREHQQQSVLHLAVLDDALQLVLGLVHAVAVIRVDDEDQALRAGEVMSPQRPDLVLSADVPDVEFGIFVRDALDVEADGRDGRHVGIEFELVQDCCKKGKRKGEWSAGRPTDRRTAEIMLGHTGEMGDDQLVFPAASSPSINSRISFDPKIFAITLDTWPPITPEILIMFHGTGRRNPDQGDLILSMVSRVPISFFGQVNAERYVSRLLALPSVARRS